MSMLKSIEFTVINCGHENGGCGMDFAMTEDFYLHTKETGETWYCPKGHPRVWGGETTTRQLERSQAQKRHLEDQLSAAVADAERTRVELLRERQRFANGVCPCCNRSFENVRRHMKSQHPEYDVSRVEEHQVKFACSCGRSFTTFRGLRSHQGHARPMNWSESGLGTYRAHLTKV